MVGAGHCVATEQEAICCKVANRWHADVQMIISIIIIIIVIIIPTGEVDSK